MENNTVTDKTNYTVNPIDTREPFRYRGYM